MLSISRLSDGGELLRIEIRDRYPFHDDGRGASRLEGRGRFPIRCGAEARRVLCRAIIGGLQGSERGVRSEEHTSELQSLMRISYAVFCLKKNTQEYLNHTT